MAEGDSLLPRRRENDGGYYTSITDLLLGLLFIFLIILAFFASELRASSEAIITADATRTKMLGEIGDGLARRGIKASVNESQGVIRLTAEEMFPIGSAGLSEEGDTLVAGLGDVLGEVLPCYTWRRDEIMADDCQHAHHFVSLVVIEGHTDQDPVTGKDWFADNWDLSAARASSTYRALALQQPGLTQLVNKPLGDPKGETLFSIAGFGETRPIDASGTPEGNARNRRIDIRFTMAPPSIMRLTPLPAREVAGDASRKPLDFNRRVRFGAGLETANYLAQGWSDPESWGVWTVGPSAEVRLPVAKAYTGELQLELRGVSFVEAESPERSVEVFVNGNSAGTIKTVHPNKDVNVSLYIPPAAYAPGDIVSILFRVSEPVSPSALGISNDPRQIGFGLVDVRLRKPV